MALFGIEWPQCWFFFYNRNFDFLYLFLCDAFLFCPIVVHITHMPASIVGKHALHKCTETVMAVVYTKTTAESAQLSDTIDTHKCSMNCYLLNVFKFAGVCGYIHCPLNTANGQYSPVSIK